MKNKFIILPHIFLMCGFFFFVPARAQEKNGKPFIKFEETKYNFGFVNQGEVVKIEYAFKNTGTEPLLISKIEVTCGCTVADFPRHPVKAGEEGIILITFDTKEKYDRQDRTVEVISNASNSPVKLRFKGVVLRDKKEKKKR